MLFSITAVISGLVILVWSADKFIDGAANIARILGVPSLIVGMIIIGIGTSAPEMLVSATAALQGNPGIGIGNAIGSNITNITLVLGITAIVFNLPVHSTLILRELPLILAFTILVWFLFADRHFSSLDGVLLLGGLVIMLSWMFISSKRSAKAHDPLVEESIEELPEHMSLKPAVFWSITGLLLLLVSSKLLVWGASNIASSLGVSDLVIGLTIVAIGTSLPELAATISSARRGETDLAVGNIVGSNLFNTLAVLPLPGIIAPSTLPEEVLSRDLPIMTGLTVLLLLFSIGNIRNKVFEINRWKGIILLAAFIAYEIMLYFSATGT